VIRNTRQPTGPWRQVLLTLAILAVALKVLIPPGFMAAAPSNDLPFAIVLCTAQGALTIGPGESLPAHGKSDQPAKSSHDSPCVFAGHGLGAPPPTPADLGPAEFVAYRAPVASTPPGLAPGRGLTGPPLPARGPPSLLI
jgi:hypothetical protein